MIKNLNDLLSLLVLCTIVIYSIRILVWSYVKKENFDSKVSKENLWKMILDYNDNIEE